jgi:hypothetical protein
LSLIVQSALASLLFDDAKAKLVEMLPLLNENVSKLVQDVELIKRTFKQIQSQLPRDLKSKMLQDAYIEN